MTALKPFTAFRYLNTSGHAISKVYKAKGSVDKQVTHFGSKVYIIIYSVILRKFIFSTSSKKFCPNYEFMIKLVMHDPYD